MKRSQLLKIQEDLAKKAGISQRSISNMLDPEKNMPRLDQIEKVAKAFDLATWQLLLDVAQIGKGLADMLMRPAVGDEDERLAEWDRRVVRKKKGGGANGDNQ